MIHDIIKMIDNINFFLLMYGFIYECANLINNLYDYDNYNYDYNYNYHKKKIICIFPQNRYKEFHKKIIKLYFNKWYIKFFYLL